MGGASTLGALLRRHRHAAGMTLEQLAEASGISGRAISDLERGFSRAPQRRTLTALADALDLTAEDRADLREAAASGATVAEPPVGTCEPPRSVVDFSGRASELAQLAGHVSDDPHGPTAVAVICGQAGLGKTTLAVQAARELRERFPDGCYYIDLRGVDSSPVTAADALARLLRAFGIADRQIAADRDERSGQFRAVLRERRSLVILDNAADEAQLRPLWPGLGAGMVLITSRRALTGLDGVLRLTLQPLSPDESMSLLRTITGSAFHQAAPDVAANVGLLCGHLPLALRIAANRLASRPGWTMAHLADRLRDPSRRLAALTAGDLAVEAAFSLSYAQLSGPARQVFRRLSLVPGADFGEEMAAVAAQVPIVEAEDCLDELVDLNLLQPAPLPARFRFHDLIRLFALNQLQADESPTDRQATHDRIMHCLLDTATVAGRWFEPDYGAPPPDWHGIVALDTSERAQTWLQVNRDNWVGALTAAAAAGEHARVVEVAEAMHWYSGRDILEGRWTEIFQLSRAAAGRLDDPRLEITHLNYLSWSVSTCDLKHQEAVELAMTAYRLATELGDRRLRGWALQYVATACFWIEGGIDRAEAALREAADHFDAVDDHDGYVQAIIGIAHALRNSAQPETALPQYEATLKALQERPVSAAVSFTAAYARNSMARTLVLLGRHAEAVVQAGIALPLIEAFGEPVLLSACLRLLGTAEAETGAVEDARVHLQRALDLFIATDQTEHVEPTRAALAALPATAATP